MSIQGRGGFDLDSLLEEELKRQAAALQPPTLLPAHAAYHIAFIGGSTSMSAFSLVTAALTTKAAAGAAAVVLIGGAAVGTATTGSPNPTVWGQTVVAAVQGCKTTEAAQEFTELKTATSARLSVGRCVSAAAKEHGEAERAEHAKAPSPLATDKKDNSEGQPGEHPTGKPSEKPDGHAVEKPGEKPEVRTSDHPTGKPSDTPGGRPHDAPPSTPPGHRP